MPNVKEVSFASWNHHGHGIRNGIKLTLIHPWQIVDGNWSQLDYRSDFGIHIQKSIREEFLWSLEHPAALDQWQPPFSTREQCP